MSTSNQPMQLICVDEQHFPEIRKKCGVYVDKTRALYNCIQDGKYFFISRPRRFGKSLLCSTLAALFAGKKDLFKGLWIESSDWAWEEYPVLHFDMTRASSPTNTADNVKNGLMLQLQTFAQQHGIVGIAQPNHEQYFSELIKALHAKTGKQVVVIVDEYDKPLLDVIEHKDRYMAIQEVLRGFYGQLKASSEHLRFVLLTGVFKFAKTSVFSGLNNLQDLTFNPDAAELLGYTQQEINDNFPEHIQGMCKKLSKNHAEFFEILQEQYNGYAFGIDTDNATINGAVYNPFAINHVFHRQQLVEQWFASATPTFLIQKLKERSFAGFDPSELVFSFGELNDSCNPDKITALSLLYYAGYMTLKAYNKRQKTVSIDFPNAEVAQAFSGALLQEIMNRPISSFGIITRKINDLFYANNLQELKETLNQALAQMPYHLFGTQESYYQSIIYLLFNASSVVTLAEDMMNRGRMDITVLLPESVYIFELKMNQSATVALQQIKSRDYAAKYRHLGRKIYAVGIELSNGDRIIKDLQFEMLWQSVR